MEKRIIESVELFNFFPHPPAFYNSPSNCLKFKWDAQSVLFFPSVLLFFFGIVGTYQWSMPGKKNRARKVEALENFNSRHLACKFESKKRNNSANDLAQRARSSHLNFYLDVPFPETENYHWPPSDFGGTLQRRTAGWRSSNNNQQANRYNRSSFCAQRETSTHSASPVSEHFFPGWFTFFRN